MFVVSGRFDSGLWSKNVKEIEQKRSFLFNLVNLLRDLLSTVSTIYEVSGD